MVGYLMKANLTENTGNIKTKNQKPLTPGYSVEWCIFLLVSFQNLPYKLEMVFKK